MRLRIRRRKNSFFSATSSTELAFRLFGMHIRVFNEAANDLTTTKKAALAGENETRESGVWKTRVAMGFRSNCQTASERGGKGTIVGPAGVYNVLLKKDPTPLVFIHIQFLNELN